MLSTLLTKQLLRTTDNYIKSLAKAGITTVGEMLNFLPKSIEDRTNVLESFSYINIKDKNTIIVKLVSIDNQKTSGGKLLTKAVFEDKNGFMSEGVWFNRNYLATQLSKFIGKKLILSGKVKYEYGKLSFVSPEIETDLSKSQGEVLPVYSDCNYIPGSWIGSKMYNLKNYIKEIPETLPQKIIAKYKFISRAQAVEKLHFPLSKHDFELARERLAYDELYEINYKSISKKIEKQTLSEGKSISIPLNAELVKEIISKLPFELTGHQKISLFQVLKDMEKTHAMQRLLQGDVGTGKTIIAAIAIIHGIIQTSSLLPSPHSPLSLEPSPLAPLPRREGNIMYEQKKYNPAYIVELSKKLRQKQTESEEILWEILRNRKFHNLKFRRQHPIGRYIADFYCDELKIVIELDGKIHENQIEYDELRNDIIKSDSISVLRFKNEIVYEDVTQILNSIIPYIPLPLGEVRGGQKWQIGGQNKIQACLMAPTEILARQHFEGLEKLFTSYGLNSVLLVGSTTKKQKDIIKEQLKSGNIDIMIGTHALIEDDVIFHKLGLVIIDEQHRFGVKQREILEKYVSKSNIGKYKFYLEITDEDFEKVLEIIKTQEFNKLDIKKEDYCIIKDEDKITGFCRIRDLGNGDFELGHLFIDDNYRGEKLGLDLIKFVIKNKFKDGNLFLSCKKDLLKYYEKLGFEEVFSYPKRFDETIERSKEIGIPYMVMKLKTNKFLEENHIFPHSLNMTATPIPRTLALTLYGDQDLSIINEYPVGRKTIFTKVAKNDEERHNIELFVRNELEKGRQVFWISPLVEESEKIDLANAISTFESLTEIFSPFKVGLLHGKMKAKEKQEIMKAFENNEIQILSSTSVVEVGVNIPNATIMCIEGAERFGLSQLHQFRGRVGRGQHQSYCYLFPTSGKPTDRLKAMEKTNNGFELAEIDLEIRGPGEVYGVRQSGVPEFRIADIKDLELVSQIREDIEELYNSI